MSGVAAVIPLYNHERYVARAVESLLAQTVPLRRIVVVDDGSTDESLAVVRGFRDDRLTILTQANSGAHVAINRGIAAADDCDYVAILNSDDCFHPRRVEECLRFLEEHRELEIVATRLRLIDDNGQEVPTNEPRAKWFSAVWSIESDDLVEWLGVANFIGTTSNIFARRAYLSENPFPAYRYVHDYFFLIMAALFGRLAILPQVLLDYRYHAANTINAGAAPLVREVLQMNLDLMRAIAPRLDHSRALRESWARYHRAAWSSVSSFRQDLFLYVLTKLAAGEAVAPELICGEQFPELAEFPNRPLVNFYNGISAMPANSALADAYQKIKSERESMIELLQIQERLSGSRWAAIGSALGIFCPRFAGKNAREKLEALRKSFGQSNWLRLGKMLGLKSAKILDHGTK
jgi:glycosyltransferase involved in cell wall biosynthesis